MARGGDKKKTTKTTEAPEMTEPSDPFEQNFIMDPDGDTVITLLKPGSPFAIDFGPAAVDLFQDDTASELEEPAPQTFLVSSRHLILASLVFKKMLAGSRSRAGWSEATKVDGQFKVDAYEWDPQALAIVLDLVHGRHRRAPKSVSLELLSNIAAIVDYYEFHEAVEVACGSWVSTLRVSEPIPAKPERKLFLWMFNAWVFGLEDIFKTTTKVAILQTTSASLEAPDSLPIPEKVIDRMNQNRQTVVDAIVADLASLREDYALDRKGCNWSCSCFHLGALTKHSSQMKFAENPPCTGKSLAEIVYSLRDMKRPDWTSPEDGNRSNYYNSHQYGAWHKCPSNHPKASAFGQIQVPNTDMSISLGAFDLGLSGDMDTSKDSTQKETAKQKWESSPVLLRSLASIINKNRSKMMGLSIGDFVSATGADRA